jgi:hypothetical protein
MSCFCLALFSSDMLNGLYFCSGNQKNISMKKVFMFVVMLCCALSGFAEETPIELKEKGGKPMGYYDTPRAEIDYFREEYEFLSNFYPAKVYFDDVVIKKK